MDKDGENSSSTFCFSYDLGVNETFQVPPADDIFLSTKTHMDWYERDTFYDIIERVILAPFRNQFFLFLLVALALHRKHWSTLSIKILFFHWLFRGIADAINYICSFYSHYEDPRIFIHKNSWFIKMFCHFLWYTGENIGDYYLLNRTIPFIKKEKYKFLLPLTKLSYICLCIMKYMVPINQVITDRKEIIKDGKEGCSYFKKYWVIQFSIAILVMIFDVFIYINMRINVFNDNEINENSEIQNNKAWKTFKKISYARMYVVLSFGALAVLSFIISFLNETNATKINIKAFRSLTVNGPYIMYYIDNIFMSETDLISLEESISYGPMMTSLLKIQ